MHVVIIGAYGSAGSAAADRLARHPDVELTLIDDGDPGGGLCILDGCMPSKEVLSAAAHRYQARHDDRLQGSLPTIDLERTVARKNDHTLGWAEHRRDAIHQLAERDDVQFLHATARLIDDDAGTATAPDSRPAAPAETSESTAATQATAGPTVMAGDTTIDADYIIIATGSTVNVPDLPGIEEVNWLSSSAVLDATTLPDSGVVMGFGYVGMELVPYLAECGVDLTVIEHDDRPIDDGDAPFGEELLSIYERDFDIDVITNAVERRVEPTADGGVRLRFERADAGERSVVADELFLFTGRRPNVDTLGLDSVGISPGEGWVASTCQSETNDRVFVVGDANGRRPILHVAKEEGITAAENVLNHDRGERLESYDPTVHRVVFSGLGVYPFARVGQTASSAAAAGIEPIVVSRRAEADGVFPAKDVPDGLARLVVDATDGTVIGWQGLHYHADVMAKTMQVVVELGLDVRELPDRAYHPTTPEILDGLIRAATDELAA